MVCLIFVTTHEYGVNSSHSVTQLYCWQLLTCLLSQWKSLYFYQGTQVLLMNVIFC